eukprot:gene2961-1213_t
MALSDPPKEAEYVFAVIYTFEVTVKVLAKGFILHKYSYLRNSWNWLDFFVVIVGYVTMIPEMEDYSGVKTFRVLRALKTISTVKGLKAMVNTLLKSMRMMTDVLILTLFFIAIFALIGLQLFTGRLQSRCVRTGPGIPTFNQDFYKNKSNWYQPQIGGVICGNASTAWNCIQGYVCVAEAGPNPKFGYIGYDNFVLAMLTSLQVCTLDYWESVYDSVIAAMGEPYMIYFLLAVFLGPFYLLNLVLAVVSASYEQEVNGDPDLERENERLEDMRRSASTYSFDGRHVAELLHGTSPVVEIDGEKQYNIDNLPKSLKKNQEEFMQTEIGPPELGENPSCILKIRVKMYIFVGSTIFEGFITACIMLNTIAMATEHYKQPKIMDIISNTLNYIFTAIFVLEMIFKLIALTPRGYARNNWNLFDGFLVVASLLDLVLSESQLVAGSGLSVMRVFRLLRVLKLAQSWKTMGQLLSTIGNSIGALGNITVILCIIIYIFAVVGMQLFGSKYTEQVFGGNIPRYNFKNFGNSFMMIFRILCGKWIEPQWDLLRATSPASFIFIFIVFVIGRWVVLNLFLALLLSSFGGDALKGNEDDEEGKEMKKTRLQRLIEWTKSKRKRKSKDETQNKADANMNGEHQTAEVLMASDFNGVNGKANPKNGLFIEMNQRNQINGHSNGNVIPANGRLGNGNDLKPPPLISHDSDNSLLQTRNGNLQGMADRRFSGSGVTELAIQGKLDDNGSEKAGKEQPRGHSSSSVKIEIHRERTYIDDCFCLCCYACNCCYTSYLDSPPRRLWHNIRYYCKFIVENKYFEFLILFLIAFSSLTLVFEDINLSKRRTLSVFLDYCNFFFAIIFTLEFLIKFIGFGCIKYFTNLWNLLDFFIVVISLASLFGNPNLNALRSLRALRPLRAISRFEGMKIVVNSLVHSIPSIANVLLVCGVFWLIFSVMGFTLFGGKFFRCVDKDENQLSYEVIEDKASCLNNTNVTGYRWVNKNINFDNAAIGFLALFQTATLEGWFEVMQDAYDSREQNLQPKPMNNFFTQLYFVVFIILGAFFILNLFIGVIIDNFNRLKQQYEDGIGILLTAGQRNWINTLKSAADKKPTRRLTRPTSKWRGTLFDFTTTKQFELFIMSVIIANMLTMMIQHHGQSDEVTIALDYLNYLFTGIFTIEAIIRLVAMRLEYFKSFMNVFDFIVVVFSVGVILWEKLKSGNEELYFSPGLLRVIRVFRLGRLLRFFDSAKGIRQLLFTIVKSAPALLNIGTLLFLVMFIYAIMGMNFFMYIKETGSFNQIVNFKTFGSSMCLLFRIATAAGWNGVLEATMVKPPLCDKTPRPEYNNNHNCGSPTLAIFFFVSYITAIVLIMINMYIAVILENFNQAQSQDEAGITEDDLEAFYSVWEQFDPKATQFIKYYQLPDFLDALDGPLRVPKPNYWFLEENEIPVKDRHKVHCLDIMASLIKRAIGEVEGGESQDFLSVMTKVEERFRASFPTRSKETTKITTAERLKIENAAARRIQKVFRRHLLITQIKQMSSSKNMTLRARERNQEQVEHLITILWKNQAGKNSTDGNDSDESDADESPRKQ